VRTQPKRTLGPLGWTDGFDSLTRLIGAYQLIEGPSKDWGFALASAGRIWRRRSRWNCSAGSRRDCGCLHPASGCLAASWRWGRRCGGLPGGVRGLIGFCRPSWLQGSADSFPLGLHRYGSPELSKGQTVDEAKYVWR